MNSAPDDTAKAASRRVRDPLVMPFSNVRHLDFRGKIRAARLAGFGQLSLHPRETRDTIKGGLRPEDMLEEIPGDQIHCVQLNDGPLRLPAGVTLEENCFDRGWPGTGEFPLIEIVRTLADLDALRQVSPEVFSPHNATRSAVEIAALSSGSLHALLDAANVAY